MDVNRCEMCRYWDPLLDESSGWCRERSPMVSGDPGESLGWPLTGADDWCGNWKPLLVEHQVHEAGRFEVDEYEVGRKPALVKS